MAGGVEGAAVVRIGQVADRAVAFGEAGSAFGFEEAGLGAVELGGGWGGLGFEDGVEEGEGGWGGEVAGYERGACGGG